MTESIRLSKRLAELLSCSRSQAEQYIEGGWVLVDGQAVEEQGARVLPQQKVELLPQASLAAPAPVTILLHKAAGYNPEMASLLQMITAEHHAADDRSGIRFIKRHLTGLTLADPLEAYASGFLVLTQDWRIARKLIDDTAKVEQEFIVEVSGTIIEDGLKLLNHGLKYNGRELPPIKVSWQSETRLRFALKGPQLGQVKSMCEKVGLDVLAMKRIRIGRLPMAGLQAGQWRYLLGYEQF
jgi:23S rRNA pseudouridine2604 synthase